MKLVNWQIDIFKSVERTVKRFKVILKIAKPDKPAKATSPNKGLDVLQFFVKDLHNSIRDVAQ